MSRHCTVCVHTERAAINRALVGGESNRVIARQYAVSHDAVRRHRAHIPVALSKAAEAKEVAQADSLLSSIVALRERLEGSLGNAETARDVASLARELRETLRLMLELEGRLRKGAAVQVAVQTNVAVAEEADDGGDGDRFGKVLDILAKAKAIVLPGQTEDQGVDPGPSDPGQSADEAHLLATGTVTESATTVTVTQVKKEVFLLDPADPDQILSLARRCGFPRLPLRKGGVIPAGESEWRRFLPGCSSQTLQHIAETLAALASSHGRRVRITSGAAQGAEVPSTNEVDSREVFSLLSRLGSPPIELQNGRRIAAGEPNWRRALAEADGETWRLALDALEALDASFDDQLTEVGRTFSLGRRCRFMQLTLRDGRTIPEGEAGWRQSLAGADRGALRLVLEALGMRWGAGDDERF